jgi:hypothetical protein
MASKVNELVASLERLKKRRSAYKLVLWILLEDAAKFKDDREVLDVLESLRKVVSNWINITEEWIKVKEDELHREAFRTR